MTTQMSGYAACKSATGVVIPVYVPDEVDGAVAAALVRDTAGAFRRQVGDPRSICLSADGPGTGKEIAEAIARDLGVQAVAGETRRGKLGALRVGVQRLMANEGLAYFATADQDGDHFAGELVSFVRAAQHVEQSARIEKVIVLGRRISRHRPMGFLRGELEELADRMLLDALAYNAAVAGVPLAMEFANTLDEFPDFHSGYKLFTRATAADVFLAQPDLAGCTEEAAYRHAVEAVLCVEAMLAGARLAVVNRSTLDEQPVTTFGLLDRVEMIADKIIWPCRRLRVPSNFVDQWLRNHLGRLLLATLVPQGREELASIRNAVLAAFDLPPDPPDRPLPRSEFL